MWALSAGVPLAVVVVGKSVTAIAAISVVNVAAKSEQRGVSSRLDEIGARPAVRGGHTSSAVAMINQRMTADRAGAGRGWSGVERGGVRRGESLVIVSLFDRILT